MCISKTCIIIFSYFWGFAYKLKDVDADSVDATNPFGEELKGEDLNDVLDDSRNTPEKDNNENLLEDEEEDAEEDERDIRNNNFDSQNQNELDIEAQGENDLDDEHNLSNDISDREGKIF